MRHKTIQFSQLLLRIPVETVLMRINDLKCLKTTMLDNNVHIEWGQGILE